MKNESWMQTLKDYAMLTIGTLLIAIGVYFFKFPNHFSTGGVSGISIVLAHYAPNLSAGAFVRQLFLDARLWKKFVPYALLAAVLALPQLWKFTFAQADNAGFLHLSFNWVNQEDPYLWFYI